MTGCKHVTGEVRHDMNTLNTLLGQLILHSVSFLSHFLPSSICFSVAAYSQPVPLIYIKLI